jgi:porin
LISSLNRTRTNIFQDPRTFFANIVTTQSIPTTTANSWAIYYNSYQYIQGDQQHGWGPFLRAGLSDGSPNPIRWNIAGGVGGKGLIPDRDADGWGVGIYHLQPSGGGFLTAANLRGETGGEVYYNIAFTAAIHTTLDTQLVSSARPRQETAWVLGARLNVDF